MTARRASSPAPSAERSTPSRAGRSRPNGGSSRWSASTGRRCLTTTFYASCITTSNRTDGSWSGSMTERSDAPSSGISAAGFDLTQARAMREKVHAVVGHEPDSVRVVDRKSQPTRSRRDPFLHPRRMQQRDAFRSDGDNWKPVRGKSEETYGRCGSVDPDSVGAGGKIKLHQSVSIRSDL